MDSKLKNAKQVYQRSLSRGLILKPKQKTLEKYGLTEYWENVKTQQFKTLQFRSRKLFLAQAASGPAESVSTGS